MNVFRIGISRTHVLLVVVLITGLSLAWNFHLLAEVWRELDEAEAEEVEVVVERVKIPAESEEEEEEHGASDRSGRARSGRDLRARDPR